MGENGGRQKNEQAIDQLYAKKNVCGRLLDVNVSSGNCGRMSDHFLLDKGKLGNIFERSKKMFCKEVK